MHGMFAWWGAVGASLGVALMVGATASSASAQTNVRMLCADPASECAARVSYGCAAERLGAAAIDLEHGLGRPDFVSDADCAAQIVQFRGCLVRVANVCPLSGDAYVAERQRFIDSAPGLSDFAASLLAFESGEPSYLRAYGGRAEDAERRERAFQLAEEIDARRSVRAAHETAVSLVQIGGDGWADGAPYGQWRCETPRLGPVFLVFDRDDPSAPAGDLQFGVSAPRTVDAPELSASDALAEDLSADLTLDQGVADSPSRLRIEFPQGWAFWPDGEIEGCVFQR